MGLRTREQGSWVKGRGRWREKEMRTREEGAWMVGGGRERENRVERREEGGLGGMGGKGWDSQGAVRSLIVFDFSLLYKK